MKRAFVCNLLVWALAGAAFAQTNLICRLAPGVTPVSVAATYGIQLVDSTEGAPFAYYSLPSGVSGDGIRIRMLGDARITWADDDAGLAVPEPLKKGSTLPAIGGRSALYEANTNFLNQIHWSKSLSQGPGRPVRVAILDTGLSPFQPYLWQKVVSSLNVIEPNLPAYDIPQGQDTNDDGVLDGSTGHGTMVAGVVDQISPNSSFVIARVADSDGNASGWTLIKGLAFAVTEGAEVANVSLGTLDRIKAMTDVMEWCESNNLVVVAAIGNNNLRTACFPAGVRNAICVGGLLPNNTKAPFSNWENSCLVSAPATGIVSQDWDGHIGIWSGTSFAAPIVTGAVVEGLRRNSSFISAARVRSGLKSCGGDLDKLNPSYKGQLGKSIDFGTFVLGLHP